MSVFSAVPLAPRDPILGVTEAFREDPRGGKVNLGVGVYQDEQGRIPVLDCVRQVELAMGQDPRPHGYVAIDGFPLYLAAVRALVFGDDSELITSARVASLQALGGTGGLRLGAGVLAGFNPRPSVLVSDPSWENHEALFRRAGFQVGRYRYLDSAQRGVDVEGMLEDLGGAPVGTIAVLHACCHNPTGYDLSPDDWQRVVAVCGERDLIPFLDMAYQGFGGGLKEDAHAVAQFAAAGRTFLVATSFSKSLSLYGERVGAISFVTA
ncbi:MAG: aminotransferase class I/II-fold pyridoxal phosphate-dependent enzyme, partial [Propionibacteriaceae bacterium]|nr:aminotransferase class I/II-fold pyridoxal phosphate-dependent enzyme [Propionibacteriaceae bacterium]